MPSSFETIEELIEEHRPRITEEIGPFKTLHASRGAGRSRRRAAIILEGQNEFDRYEATLTNVNEKEFAPGLTIRCLVSISGES